LKEAFETTAAISRNEWKYAATLEIDVPPGLAPVPLLRDEFNQVLLNLVINAAHAVAERHADGPASGRITLSARDVADGVEIRVSDNGIGIPQAVRHRIFEPFFTTKPLGKGTGQGLAIAWNVVVEQHGGTLTVESEPGVGTAFVIRLGRSAGPA
jgi:signal transduction histidine kinase